MDMRKIRSLMHRNVTHNKCSRPHVDNFATPRSISADKSLEREAFVIQSRQRPLINQRTSGSDVNGYTLSEESVMIDLKTHRRDLMLAPLLHLWLARREQPVDPTKTIIKPPDQSLAYPLRLSSRVAEEAACMVYCRPGIFRADPMPLAT